MFTHTTNKLKYRNLAIALFIGFLIYLIHISGWLFAYAFQDKTAPAYGSFSILTNKGDQGYTSDITRYATQIRDVFLNGFSLLQRDPYTYENANKHFPNGNLIYALASLTLWFSSNPNIMFVLGPLISILICMWLLKRIMVEVNGYEFYANNQSIFMLVACALLLTSNDCLLTPSRLAGVITGAQYLPRNLYYIGRFPHIEFSIFLLLGWYYFLRKAINKNSLPNNLKLGFFLAVLQYSYFFWWTSAIAFTAAMIIIHVRNKLLLLKSLTSVFGLYLVLALPFWIRHFSFIHSALGAEYPLRVGEAVGRSFVINKNIVSVIYFLLALDVFCYYFKTKRAGNFFKDITSIIFQSSWQLILALCVLFFLNIQILIRYTPQPYHWNDTFYYPIAILLSIDYLGRLLDVIKSMRMRLPNIAMKISVCLLIGVIITAAIAQNYFFGKRSANYYMFTKNEKDLIDYVERELPKKSVIMSNNFSVLQILNANTGCLSFVPDGFIAYSTNDEILRRAIIGYALIGYAKEDIKEEFKKSERWIPEYIADVRSLKYEAPPPLSATIPDNLMALSYIGHLAYYKKRAYPYSDYLDRKIDALWNEAKSLIVIPYKLDYIVLYKRYLPKHFNSNTYPHTLFENGDFALLLAPTKMPEDRT